MSLNYELSVPGIYILYYESNDFQYYVGKAVNIRIRYKQHCRALLKEKHKNRKLTKGYNTHGALPSIAILEVSEDFSSLFAKEIEWIAEFDSFNNGMNLTIGGEGVGSGEGAPGALYTEEVYIKILEALGDVNKSIPDITKLLKVSTNVISNISTGTSHTYLKVTHPELWDKMVNNIGKRTPSLYLQEEYLEIVALLAEKYSLLEVAEITNVPYYIISNISQGVAHSYLEELIPIDYALMRKYAQAGYYLRKYKDPTYIEILELLAYTDLSYREISEKISVPIHVISSISTGYAHKYLKEEYPLAYTLVESKRCSTRGILPKIIRLHKYEESIYVSIMAELANTNKKLNIVAKEQGVDEGIVEDISRGSTHKHLQEEYPDLYNKMISKKGSRKSGPQSGGSYPNVIDPKGNLHTAITNAKQFAIDHGLHQGHFGELLRGKAKSHKGWILA